MIALYHADARTCAEALADTHAAACIVDPPYSAHVHARSTSIGTQAHPQMRDLGFTSLDDATRAAIVRVAASCSRWSAIFSDIEGAQAWREALVADTRLEYVRAVPWVRWSQPQLSGDRPPSGCELVTLVHPKGAKRWSGPGSLTAFDTRSLRGNDKHPCEKPLDLMLSLVSWFSDAGELVVDPCAGAGTTLLAARLLERDAIGLELNADSAAHGQARIAAPLSTRDRERCERWIEYQAAWLASEPPATAAGAARYARAREDTARVLRAMEDKC